MKKKNWLSLFAILLFTPFVFVSCSDDDDPTLVPDLELSKGGAYILNAGAMQKNNSTLDYYDFDAEELNTDVFNAVNGRGLGDTANDMIVYGSKAYIAVTGSATLEVVDLKGKSIQQIMLKDSVQKPQNPRYLTSYEGKVYVTTQDGFVSQIDTTELKVVNTVEVGKYPEQLCVSKGMLYVTISGQGIDNKIVSVDIPTFQAVDTIEVVLNPTEIQADKDGMLYVTSSGDYTTIKNTLQKINPTTGESTVLLENSMIRTTLVGNYLYAISVEQSSDFKVIGTEYKKYNVTTAKFEDKGFVNKDVSIKDAQYVSVDPNTEEVYLLASDFVNTGNTYVISKEGKLLKEIPVSGINPMCVRFVTTE